MFSIDNVKAKTESFEGLGMLFNKDVPVGFDQITGKLSFNGPSSDLFPEAQFAYETTNATLLGVMIDQQLTGSGTANKQFKAEMTIRPVEVGIGNFENHKNTEFERSFMIDRLVVFMDAVEVLNIDPENNVWKINGVDKWQQYRALLGQ